MDIVERLADMIRAATGQPTGQGASKTSPGFVVTPQMTSLAGCSGEQFASILRSLGYVDASIKRSEFVQSSSPAAPAGNAEAAAPASVEATQENSAPVARDGVQLGADDPPHPLDESLKEEGSDALGEAALASDTPPEAALAEAAPATAEALAQVEAPEQVEARAQVEASAGAERPGEIGASATAEAPAEADQATTAEPDKSPKDSATTSHDDDEMITVWRRAPRFQPGPARSRSAGRRPERQVAEATTDATTTPHTAKAEDDRPRFRRRRHAAKPDATSETGGRPVQSGPRQATQRPESATSPGRRIGNESRKKPSILPARSSTVRKRRQGGGARASGNRQTGCEHGLAVRQAAGIAAASGKAEQQAILTDGREALRIGSSVERTAVFSRHDRSSRDANT